MKNVLYEVEGPGCAVLEGGSWGSERECAFCGSTRSVQIKNLSAELICPPPRNVCTPIAEVLVTLDLARQLEEKHPLGMYLQPVETDWYGGQQIHYDDWGPPPSLVQIRSTQILHAAPQSRSYGQCPHHANGITRPLSVLTPKEWGEYGVWIVYEGGGILLFTKALRDIFAAADADLTFIEVPCVEEEMNNTA